MWWWIDYCHLAMLVHVVYVNALCLLFCTYQCLLVYDFNWKLFLLCVCGEGGGRICEVPWCLFTKAYHYPMYTFAQKILPYIYWQVCFSFAWYLYVISFITVKKIHFNIFSYICISISVQSCYNEVPLWQVPGCRSLVSQRPKKAGTRRWIPSLVPP